MIIPMLIIVAGIAAIAGVGGAVAGTVKAIANNVKARRANSTNVEHAEPKEEVAEEIVEEPEVVEEVEQELSRDSEEKLSKEKWLEQNAKSQEELHDACSERINQLYPKASAEKKEFLTRALEDRWGNIVNAIRNSENVTELPANFNVENYASNQGASMLNDVSAKYDVYKSFENETVKSANEYSSREKIVVDTKNDVKNVLKNAKVAILNTREPLETYKNRIDSDRVNVNNMLNNMNQFVKMEVNIQEAMRTAKTTEQKVDVLTGIVEAYSLDIKSLLSVKQELAKLAVSVDEMSENTKEEIRQLEERVNKNLEQKVKELKTKITNVAKTKVNSSTLNSKLLKIQKALDGKASIKELQEIRNDLDEVKSVGLSEEEIENIKAVATKRIIDLAVPQVVEKASDKISKLDAKTRKQIVKETIKEVEKQISEEVNNIDIDSIADKVVEKIEIVNRKR